MPALAALLSLAFPTLAEPPALHVLADRAPEGTLEVRGVSAGDFRPDLWVANRLHWVFDTREPLLEPREGPARNIYAPSAVRVEGGWRLFYGAWDGCETTNDRIWGAWTSDFLSFEDRHLVIDHGPFIHTCNCHVSRDDQGWLMAVTAYPHLGAEGLNRPAIFTSPDGITWNGALPHTAGLGDLVTIEGYAGWETADINGMNVLLREDGVTHMYFGDFRDWGKVRRATSSDLRTFAYDGECADLAWMVNDVQRFDLADGKWYVMALHHNGDELGFALSRDGMEFDDVRLLTKNRSEQDAYIVAVGLVRDGNRVLGALYGAGAVPSLDHNRLFAKWLQRKVEVTLADGSVRVADAAWGPDAVQVTLAAGDVVRTIRVFAEDGETVLLESTVDGLASGAVVEFEG